MDMLMPMGESLIPHVPGCEFEMSEMRILRQVRCSAELLEERKLQQ
jgi:hypothetical protein